MNWITGFSKRLILAALWLASFAAVLWGLLHRDEAFSYFDSFPPALKQLLTAVMVVAIYGVAAYVAWGTLVARSLACSVCHGSGQLLRINHRYNTKEIISCSACGGRGQVFGLRRKGMAFLTIGVGFIIMLLMLNIVLDGALNGVLRLR